MDIQCTIERKGGTQVKMDDGTSYHFKPEEAGGPHIASVSNKKHIKTLLSIPEAYEPFIEGEDDETPEEPVVGTPEESAAELINASDPDDDDETGPNGEGDPAVESEDATTAEPVEPAVIDPQEALATVKAAATAEDVSRADLDAAFELLNQRKPNPQAKDETIFDRIKQALEAEKTDAAE